MTFLLDLDTGSSLLWVQAQLSSSDPSIDDQNQYNPTTSKTAQARDQTQRVNYGDGSHVEASLYSDNVIIEKLLAKNQQLGAVSSANLSSNAIQGKSNGLIGLGFPPDDDNLVQNLQQQGVIKYASITLVGPRNDPKKAGEIDAKAIMEPRGYLIVGSVDPKYYTGDIAWCPRVSDLDGMAQNRWVVKLDSVSLNGKVVFQNQYALIDTGTSYIMTSPTSLDQFRRQITGAKITPSKKYMFMYPPSSITSVSFVLGGREIQLHPSDFSLGEIKPDSKGNLWALSSICTVPGGWPFPDNLWILGGIFIDNVVSIFDFGEKKIGFADISENDLASEVTAQ